MGNQQSLDDRYKDFLSEWIMLQIVIDPRYGQVQLYRSVTGELACLITKTTTQDVNEKPIQMHLKHPNLVNLYIYDIFKTKDICNSSTKINIVYEYLSNDLLKSIGFRKKQKAMFSEPQIWLILKSVLSSLAYLKQHDIDHQNLTPENILITGTGVIKLLDPNLLGKTSSYIQTLMNIKEDIYLSPEQLEGIRLKKPNIRYDKERSEVFTLGLCLIYAITLEDLKDVLNRNELEISFPRLQLVVQNIHDLLGFSNTLVGFLKLMLQEKPAKRPTFQQLLTSIEKNRFPLAESVLNFENNKIRKADTSNPSLSTTNTPSTLDNSQKDNIWFRQSQKTIAPSEPMDQQIIKSQSQKVLAQVQYGLIKNDKNNQIKQKKEESPVVWSEPVQKLNKIPQAQLNDKSERVKLLNAPSKDKYFISNWTPQYCQLNPSRENPHISQQSQQTSETINSNVQGNLSHRILSNKQQDFQQKPQLTHREHSLNNNQSQGNLLRNIHVDQKQNHPNSSDFRKRVLSPNQLYSPIPVVYNEDLNKQRSKHSTVEPEKTYQELLQNIIQNRTQQYTQLGYNYKGTGQFTSNFQTNFKDAYKYSSTYK